MDWGVRCEHCGKENIVTMELEQDSVASAITETMFGIRTSHFTGYVECLCGYFTQLMLTHSCTETLPDPELASAL